jgi:hypothetical protein
VGRGERLIKRGDGWFSTKAILVVWFCCGIHKQSVQGIVLFIKSVMTNYLEARGKLLILHN